MEVLPGIVRIGLPERVDAVMHDRLVVVLHSDVVGDGTRVNDEGIGKIRIGVCRVLGDVVVPVIALVFVVESKRMPVGYLPYERRKEYIVTLFNFQELNDIVQFSRYMWMVCFVFFSCFFFFSKKEDTDISSWMTVPT